MRLDRQYVNHWGLGLDFQILLQTVAVVFTGRDAV
jgi:lipopolysaccharide/colanic/teichoic acid biosynthesis glycosyltransferase